MQSPPSCFRTIRGLRRSPSHGTVEKDKGGRRPGEKGAGGVREGEKRGREVG